MIVIVCVAARLWDVTISIDKRGMPGWCRGRGAAVDVQPRSHACGASPSPVARTDGSNGGATGITSRSLRGW
jgi:hypothetical protein